MEILKDGKLFEIKYEPAKAEKRVDFEFQQVGIELEPFYGKAIWPMFYKYQLVKILDAHKVCVKNKIFTLAYLIGVMKKLK